jgi:integrase
VEEFLFQPSEACQRWSADRRQNRQTPMTPSQRARKRKARPKRTPRDHYTVDTYYKAVARACVLAKVPHWHPNQLRHTRATEIRRRAGLDAARAVLGHRSPGITATYAELDQALASEVMAAMG